MMAAVLSPGGVRKNVAAPGRKAGGALPSWAQSQRRAGGNRHYYPRVSVGLISPLALYLSDGRVRHDH